MEVWLGPLFSVIVGALGALGYLWGAGKQRAVVEQAERRRDQQAAIWAAEQADAAVARHKQEKRHRNEQELRIAEVLASADRFTVHPEFVRLWKGPAVVEVRLKDPIAREFVDRLGLPFDSLEHPSPTPRPRGSEPIVNGAGEIIAWAGGEHIAEPQTRVGPLRASIVNVTRAQYDALPEVDPRTFYRITDALRPTLLMRAADYDALMREARPQRAIVAAEPGTPPQVYEARSVAHLPAGFRRGVDLMRTPDGNVQRVL